MKLFNTADSKADQLQAINELKGMLSISQDIESIIGSNLVTPTPGL